MDKKGANMTDSDKMLEHIKKELDSMSEELCNVHKLSSILYAYCKSRSEDDSLYEVSYIAELIEKKLSKLGYDFYDVVNFDKEPQTMEEALSELHKLHSENKIVFTE